MVVIKIKFCKENSFLSRYFTRKVSPLRGSIIEKWRIFIVDKKYDGRKDYEIINKLKRIYRRNSK